MEWKKRTKKNYRSALVTIDKKAIKLIRGCFQMNGSTKDCSNIVTVNVYDAT